MNALEIDHITRCYGPPGRARHGTGTGARTGAGSARPPASVQGPRRGFTAVDDVSFEVRSGELVAVLGVNGAGKTSLVEIVEGLAPPTSGSVRVLGRDPVRERALVRPHTGMMLQEAGFAGDLTVRETLTMWAGTLTAPRPVADSLELVDLRARADVRVKSLSGGERRRLDLAMATLGRPQVLFLDEPTTGLDPASRRRTWDLIRSMLDGGTTVLLTTHYLEEAEELADRVLVMSRGRIVARGTVAEIVASQPSSIAFTPSGGPGAAPPSSLEISPIDEGGRAWPGPSLARGSGMAGLPGLVAAPLVERGRVHLRTDDLQATLGALLRAADADGVRLLDLDARSASLEQAFLAMTVADAAGEAIR